MNTQTAKPVIFLAFANSSVSPLPNLADEYRRLRATVEQAEQLGLCELAEEAYATVDDIVGKFQDERYRGRIAIFHYAGHADSYGLLLEGSGGQPAVADAGGLAAFLSHQTGLQLVFLNACATQPQVQGLLDAGVAVVIATSQDIDDQVAADFAVHIYQFLAGGDSIGVAFDKAQAATQIAHGADARDLYVASQHTADVERWPWDRYVRPGAEIALHWNLPDAAADPLFGLPPLPVQYYQRLPDSPFRGLTWFATEHAAIFFGRGYQIRELYQQVATPHLPPLILFYGQSGVGKSSLLAAGLTPRLEASHTIIYLRRDQQKGLLGALQTALMHHTDASSLPAAWAAVENHEKRPLLVVLDQAEEVFTRPNLEQPHELADLLVALQALCADVKDWPQGKLVLSFRKEWLAEIKRQVMEHRLPYTELFLQRLDKRSVVEAIEGPTQSPELQHKYRLTIAEALPGLIADDLLADPGSAVAPALQILLTKLWEVARLKSYDRPLFDAELYAALRQQGLALSDILDQQLAELKQRQPDPVASGLALDLLAFHTTPLGTAEERTREEMHQVYVHRRDVLNALIQDCSNLYLLVDPARNEPAKPPSHRLAHDTLAPLVRRRFDESDASGQRARRILENRAADWQGNHVGAALDDADLTVVEAGAAGMRSQTDAEQRLVAASRTARGRRARRNRMLMIAGVMAGIAILISSAIAILQSQTSQRLAENEQIARSTAQAESTRSFIAQVTAEAASTRAFEQSQISLSRQLAAQATALRDQDPPLALLLSVEALKAADSVDARNALLTGLTYSPHLATFLHGHKNFVASVAFSPDGSTLASGSCRDLEAGLGISLCAPDEIRLWDVKTGKHLADLQGDNQGPFAFVTRVAFSQDGEELASLSDDGAVTLWNVKNGQSLGAPNEGDRVVFGPSGQFILATRTPEGLVLKDKTEGRPLGPPFTGAEVDAELAAFTITPAGQLLLMTHDADGYVLWNASDGQALGPPLLAGHTGAVTVSRDGQRLASAHEDGSITVWEVANGQPFASPLLGHTDLVTSLVFSPDGARLASSSLDKTIIVWDLLNHRQQGAPLVGHTDRVNAVAFSPDGLLLASGASNENSHHLDNRVILWDVGAQRPFGQILTDGQTPGRSNLAMAVTPAGKTLLASVSPDGVMLWDKEAGSLGAALNDSLGPIALSSNGRWVATGNRAHGITVWEVATRQPRAQFSLEHAGNIATPPSISEEGATDRSVENGAALDSIAFSPDSTILASLTSDGRLDLWDIKSGSVMGRPYQGVGAAPEGGQLTFSANGQQLSYQSEQGFVLLDATIIPPIAEQTNVNYGFQAVASPNFAVLATLGDYTNRISLLDMKSGQPIGPPLASNAYVTSGAFSQDGSLLASGVMDPAGRGSVSLWDVGAGQRLGLPLAVPQDAGVRSVAISPDAKTLAALDMNGAVTVWSLDPEFWMVRACRIANRTLSQGEIAHYLGSAERLKTYTELAM